jgi:uncharacterized integral membrane protein (TIGR00698 family)
MSAWLARRDARQEASRLDVQRQGAQRLGGTDGHQAGQRRLTIPWFAFAFIGMVVFNSLAVLPHAVVGAAIDLDTFLLAMAMGALGLTTHLSAIRRAGIKPLLLGGLLFIWLVGGGAVINSVFGS